MKRVVTYEGYTTTAEECSIGGKTYYMIGCHVIPAGDLEVGEYVEKGIGDLQSPED